MNAPIHRIQTWHPVPGSTLPDADLLVLVRFANGAMAQASIEDDGTWILDDGTELSPETPGDTYGTVTHWSDATDPTDDQQPTVKISVRGGCAYIDEAPEGITVEITDHDNEARK